MSSFNRENRIQGPIPSFSFEQQFSLYRGTHAWKFGGILSLPRGGRPDTTATLVTFQTLQDVMRNEPASVSAESKEYPFTWRMINFGFFIQDDWRVHQKLVLNLGVRYDSYGPYVARGWKGDFGRTLKSYDMKPEVVKNLVGKLPMAVYNLDGLIDPVNFLWGAQRDPNSPYNRDNLSITGPAIGDRFGITQTGGRPDLLDVKGAVNKNCCGFGNLQYLNPAAFRLESVTLPTGPYGGEPATLPQYAARDTGTSTFLSEKGSPWPKGKISN